MNRLSEDMRTSSLKAADALVQRLACLSSRHIRELEAALASDSDTGAASDVLRASRRDLLAIREALTVVWAEDKEALSTGVVAVEVAANEVFEVRVACPAVASRCSGTVGATRLLCCTCAGPESSRRGCEAAHRAHGKPALARVVRVHRWRGHVVGRRGRPAGHQPVPHGCSSGAHPCRCRAPADARDSTRAREQVPVAGVLTRVQDRLVGGRVRLDSSAADVRYDGASCAVFRLQRRAHLTASVGRCVSRPALLQ